MRTPAASSTTTPAEPLSVFYNGNIHPLKQLSPTMDDAHTCRLLDHDARRIR
jgi:hypothetical protein